MQIQGPDGLRPGELRGDWRAESIDIDPGEDPGGNDQTGFAAHTNAIIYARAFFF